MNMTRVSHEPTNRYDQDAHATLKFKLKQLSMQPGFRQADGSCSKEEKVERLYAKMQDVVELSGIKADDLLHDMGKLLAVMESPCLSVHPGLSPLLASHYNLCLGTILSLAGANRPLLTEYIDDLEQLRAKGIYMVTELDSGNNAMSLQTRASFDAQRREFVINTPHPGACKYMPYLSSSHQPKIAIVMARLMEGNKDCGVHPFLVRCRDQDGRLLPGVNASGLSAVDLYSVSEVDHSLTAFDNVRVPRHALLGQDVSHVADDGTFVTVAKSQRELFFNSLCRVEWGKIVLVAALMSPYKIALSVAVEYCKKRTLNNGRQRIPLSSVRSHRLDLTKAYVAILGAIALYEEVKRTCLTEAFSVEQLQLHAAVVKSMCVESARSALQVCMARSGAQGKMIRNGVVSAVFLNDHTATAEGDSLPVMMKIAKDLLSAGQPPFAVDPTAMSQPVESTGHLMARMEIKANALWRQLQSRLEGAGNISDAWSTSTQIARELAWAYGMCRIASALRHRPETQAAFCVEYLLDEAAWFVVNSVISPEDLRTLRECQEQRLNDLFDSHVVHVAEDLDVADVIQLTPAGSKDMAAHWMQIAAQEGSAESWCAWGSGPT